MKRNLPTEPNPAKPCDCLKQAYYNRQEAEAVAEHQMELGAPELRVYRCPENQYIWHLARANPYD